jgi:outer membrane protein assembly factor BamB
MNNDGTFDTTDKHHAYIGYSTSTPAVYNNKVYVGAGGMYGGGDGISCLDADLTDEDWHFAAAAGAVQSSPAITTAYDDGDGEVYIYVTTNTASGKVYCVNELGVEQWSWGESGKTDWTLCGVAISDGWIFYGTDSKYVFGFATTESLSSSTPPSETPFLISGNITYDTGNPVMNPVVTVTNLATSEDFTVKTDASSNLYLTLTDSGHTSSGDTMRINANDGAIFNETDYLVTAADINDGGFVLDALLVSGGMPDLNLTAKYEEWVNTSEKTYNVTYTVENIGSADVDASNTSIRIDGVEVATGHVPELLIGTSYTGTLGPFTLSGNNDTIEICADGDGVITELDETNNCLTNVFEAPGMPDLIVWVALKTEGYVNEGNILGVRVKNAGTVDAGSFNVSLAIDGTSMPRQSVPSLGAGNSTELEFSWTPTTTGGHLLSATVDTNNDVSESDETNNDLSRTSVIIKRTDWHQFHYDVVHTGFSPSGAPDTNTTLWISDELSAIGGTSTVVADGKVFAYGGPTGWSGGDGALYCLDEFTGAILWNISIPVPAYGSWSSPAYHNGRVFTSTDIEAGCYDAATGEQIWAFENPTNGPSVNGGPIVADGKVIVNDWQEGHYYCLDEETGELLWTFTEEQTGSWAVGYTQGVPAYEDGKFYLTTWLYVGGNVYCVDADTGDVIWNQTTPLDTCGSPTVVDGTVYVTNYNFEGYGKIYAMDATDGTILWHKTIQRSDSTPAVAYGNVYVAGGAKGYSDRQTYCFNATTGNLTWSTDTADEIGAWTCSVAVADGKVFAGTEGGDSFDYAGTYALDAFTGDVIWSYPQGGSSPAVADDIVFTIGGGRVYAFYSEAVELPDLTVTAVQTPSSLRNEVINPITATIANVGGTNAENFVVSLEADGIQVNTATIATLAAGENATVELLWTPAATGNATLTVTADAGNSVEELDETNNDLSETVDVLEKLTVTANVRIEGKNETVWTGDVTFSNSTITASDGSIHYLNEPTALGALDEANELGGFGYVVESHPVYGLYISEINSEPPIGWDGWMYRVDYASPWVGAADYTLADSDEVLWYFGAWTAPPLAIELDRTTVMTGETFVATVTAYNDSTAAFDTVDAAEVYVDGALYGLTGLDGTLTMSLATAGSYQIHADKGTWADYTRSEKVDMKVTSTATYDFATDAGIDRWAYRYQTGAKPAANDTTLGIELMSNTNPKKDQYVKISTDDRKMQSDSTDMESYYAAHRFVFDITQPVEDILTIEVLWNGKGAHTDRTKSGATLYIWNEISGAYEELANTTSNKEVYLTAEMTAEIGSYVDATGNMTILVEQNSAQTAKGKREYVSKLSTDYVKVDITHT